MVSTLLKNLGIKTLLSEIFSCAYLSFDRTGVFTWAFTALRSLAWPHSKGPMAGSPVTTGKERLMGLTEWSPGAECSTSEEHCSVPPA